MLVLGIESSCDETALALVRGGRLLGQSLSSQVDVHALFGGVVPELASREHGRSIGPLYDRLMQKCGVRPEEIDGVAVARGPGLLGSLLVGVAFAKALAEGLAKPIVGVNHLHAHVLAAALEQPLEFPALALLISGGHTHLYLVRSPLDFVLLGRSLDDAAGEALDKFGKMLGLPYPAGRYIDEFGQNELGQSLDADVKLFPRPYLDNDNLDFSFSGLKTAALNLLKERPELRFLPGPALPEGKAGLTLKEYCAAYAQTVALTLAEKTRRALGRMAEEGVALKGLILAGGVAANSRVRTEMSALVGAAGLPLVAPSPALCTDNAAMIACAGEFLFKAGYSHPLSFAAVPRGQAVPQDYVFPID